METPVNDFALTAAAAQRILTLLKDEPDKRGLRIAVSGGGCSGFQYEMGLVSQLESDDLTIELDNAKVFIDPVSLDLLKGGVLDFVDDLGGSFFQITNPNATSSCGCGNSFSA